MAVVVEGVERVTVVIVVVVVIVRVAIDSKVTPSLAVNQHQVVTMRFFQANGHNKHYHEQGRGWSRARKAVILGHRSICRSVASHGRYGLEGRPRQTVRCSEQ